MKARLGRRRQSAPPAALSGTPTRAVRSNVALGRQGPALASPAARLLDAHGEQAPRERADELLLLAVSKALACAGLRAPTTTPLSLAYAKRRSDGNDLTNGRESSGANRTTRAGMHESATPCRTSASDFLWTAHAAIVKRLGFPLLSNGRMIDMPSLIAGFRRHPRGLGAAGSPAGAGPARVAFERLSVAAGAVILVCAPAGASGTRSPVRAPRRSVESALARRSALARMGPASHALTIATGCRCSAVSSAVVRSGSVCCPASTLQVSPPTQVKDSRRVIALFAQRPVESPRLRDDHSSPCGSSSRR